MWKEIDGEKEKEKKKRDRNRDRKTEIGIQKREKNTIETEKEQ